MKYLKILLEIFKPLVVAVITAITVLYFTHSDHVSCLAIEAFIGGGPSIGDFLTFLFLCFVWVILAIFYLLVLRKRMNAVLFFFLITFIPIYPAIDEALHREPEINRELKSRICNKGADDTMVCTFKNLNKVEYDFLNPNNWLPSIPTNTSNIDIFYYRDSFIGDFDLTVTIDLPEGAVLDTNIYAGWSTVYNDFSTKTSEKNKLDSAINRYAFNKFEM